MSSTRTRRVTGSKPSAVPETTTPAKLAEAAGNLPVVSAPTMLRSDSFASDDQLIVSYHDRLMQCELKAGTRTILSGNWKWQFSLAGQKLDSSDEWDNARWESNCWENTSEVAYAELQLDLPSGLQIQRQIFLARRDRFAMLADVVCAPKDVEGEYSMAIPVERSLRFAPVLETRELLLWHDRRPLVTVLPLSLPEWRRESGGILEQSHRGLTITQPFQGRRTHAALFLDLEPRRMKRQLTWRRLTVAESLQIVGRDIAVGYRIQIGKQQWLIYRSLAPQGNRTVLGQNFSTEFVVARFKPDGTAEKLLEIL